MRSISGFTFAVLLFLAPAARAQIAAPTPATNPSATLDDRPYVLHLPGIGGYMPITRSLLRGLHDGHVAADIDVDDWTDGDPGFDSLMAAARNHAEAKIVADKIALRAKMHPDQPITLICHSGGCAIGVWALEDLPAELRIQDIFMLAPALHPEYDLSASLRHVVGHMYVFSSSRDIVVLSTGTRMFGNMDGIKSDAAGLNGFVMPKDGDAAQYAKLVPCPYQDKWSDLGDDGEHIGTMDRQFVATVLAPMIEQGLKRDIADPPATAP